MSHNSLSKWTRSNDFLLPKHRRSAKKLVDCPNENYIYLYMCVREKARISNIIRGIEM